MREQEVLVVEEPHSRDHVAPPGHPESSSRLDAVHRGIGRSDRVEVRLGRLAEREELERVHRADYIRSIEAFCRAGGGMLDGDTFASTGTYDAARGVAGSGLFAIDRLRADPVYEAAFVVGRPPGHHATADRAGGFCIFNNVALAAASLVEDGERVAVIDWDVHHGNGTEGILASNAGVLYVSIHQEDLYPGTGVAHLLGPQSGASTAIDLPLPPGSTGDSYLALMAEVIEPIVTQFAPTWVLVSAGFDAHIDDPLADMALESQDFALLARKSRSFAPGPSRTVLFLEGGYHLGALETSTRAVLAALTGSLGAEPVATAGGRGDLRVRELARLWTP